MRKANSIKWAAGVVVAGIVAFGSALPASAAPADHAATSISDAGRIVPMATSVAVGGGLFSYGRDGLFGQTWSHYHHPTKYHTATACDGALFKTCKQAAAAKNVWAKASTPSSLSGNTAWWNTY